MIRKIKKKKEGKETQGKEVKKEEGQKNINRCREKEKRKRSFKK
jgi:hypothetical protein